MAEAIVNAMGGKNYRAWSAGSDPEGSVEPQALETLRRHGIDPGRPRSKSWNEFSTKAFDFVITVCEPVQNEIWPVFPGRPAIISWNIPEPGPAAGADNIIAAYDKTFLQLKSHVRQLME